MTNLAPKPAGDARSERSEHADVRLRESLAALERLAGFDPDHVGFDQLSTEVQEELERLIEVNPAFYRLLKQGARYSVWLQEFSGEFAYLASVLTPVAAAQQRRVAEALKEVEGL